ncbi:hypothetical protein ACQEVS_16865 [Streptomyces sp. CA-181903]|uniref:hypothetical protein n=1 Tax=Streptomyces sp. CA-181903 TaxID=3240055 RepID=UPI003D942A86
MRDRDREADAAALDRATDEALALLSGEHGVPERQVAPVEGGYLPFEEHGEHGEREEPGERGEREAPGAQAEGAAGAVPDAASGRRTADAASGRRAAAVPGARDAHAVSGGRPGRSDAGEALTDVWRSIREVAGADEPSRVRGP